MFKRLLHAVLLCCFTLTSINLPVYAQPLSLPASGALVMASPAYVPVIMKAVTVHPENPLLFDFVMDTGNSGLKVGQDEQVLKEESQKLVKYFLASLTLSEKDQWVNLSPYEKDRMLPEELGKTDLGRDMLAQDYMLKQVTASFLHPDKDLGKAFWARVYDRAQKEFGTAEVPVDTFNKVWVVADKAHVFVEKNTAFVVGSHLKVMLEADYVAAEKAGVPGQAAEDIQASSSPVQDVSKQLIREIVLPELEKEVNEGQSFAALRQIFHAMILATWYRKNLKDSLLNQVYTEQAKTAGVEGTWTDQDLDPQAIWKRYEQAYKQGVFNLIREDVNGLTGETVAHKYFSGGIPRNLGIKDQAMIVIAFNPREAALTGQGVRVTTQMVIPEKDDDRLDVSSKDVMPRVERSRFRSGQTHFLLQNGWNLSAYLLQKTTRTFFVLDRGDDFAPMTVVLPGNHIPGGKLDFYSLVDALKGMGINVVDRAQASQMAPVVIPPLKEGEDIILIGAPGAGKGTVIDMVPELYKISTGDLVRAEIKRNPEFAARVKALMEKGELVSDEEVLDLFKKQVQAALASGPKRFAIDGFPRTIEQAKELEAFLKEKGRSLGLVLNIGISDKEAMVRMLGRGRSDDSKETIRRRQAIARENAKPILEYYRAQRKLVSVEAQGESSPVIAAALRKSLGEGTSEPVKFSIGGGKYVSIPRADVLAMTKAMDHGLDALLAGPVTGEVALTEFGKLDISSKDKELFLTRMLAEMGASLLSMRRSGLKLVWDLESEDAPEDPKRKEVFLKDLFGTSLEGWVQTAEQWLSLQERRASSYKQRRSIALETLRNLTNIQGKKGAYSFPVNLKASDALTDLIAQFNAEQYTVAKEPVRLDFEDGKMLFFGPSNGLFNAAQDLLRKWLVAEIGDAAQDVPQADASQLGGIDLDGGKMTLTQTGDRASFRFDAAIVTQLKASDFPGLTPVIIRMVPLQGAWPLVGQADASVQVSGV